jgi:hypothetical protein
VPGETRACYSGPDGTEGVGVCVGGTETCLPDGSGYGACAGEVAPQAEDCSMGTDEDCDGTVCGETLWAGVYGNASSQIVRAVATDAQGNVYVTGELLGSIDFGGGALVAVGGSDVFLAKLDAAGQHLWSKRFGDGDVQRGTAIAVAPDGKVAIAAEVKGKIDFGGGDLSSAGAEDVGVGVFDADGAPLGSQIFGDGSLQIPTGVAFDAAGDVVITGYFQGQIGLGGATATVTSAGANDVFLGKLDHAAGYAGAWLSAYGGLGVQSPIAGLALDGSGAIWIGGTFVGSIVLGASTLQASGTDLFVARFQGDGTPACGLAITANDADTLTGISVGPGGDAVVVGSHHAALNVGAVALTHDADAANGDVFALKVAGADCGGVWGRTFATPASSETAASVAITGDGDVLLALTSSVALDVGAGAGPLAPIGANDVIAARLDAAGAATWGARFGAAAASQDSPVVGAGPTGGMILGFTANGAPDLGTGALPSAGNDVALASFGH